MSAQNIFLEKCHSVVRLMCENEKSTEPAPSGINSMQKLQANKYYESDLMTQVAVIIFILGSVNYLINTFIILFVDFQGLHCHRNIPFYD